MDIEKLAELRNAVCSEKGQAIIRKAKDFMTELCDSSYSAEAIKGMGKLIAYLERLPAEYEKNKRELS